MRTGERNCRRRLAGGGTSGDALVGVMASQKTISWHHEQKRGGEEIKQKRLDEGAHKRSQAHESSLSSLLTLQFIH